MPEYKKVPSPDYLADPDELPNVVFESQIEKFSRRQVWAAVGVHVFTTSGVVWASLAILALADHKILQMWFFLAIALFVDGIDGTLARKARVQEVLPWFDGVALDLVVDYLTWTFIPALYMYRHFHFGPGGLSDQIINVIVMIAVCTSSMFCYCNKAMKSSDYYFVGFPAAWNIVALYLMLLNLSWWGNLITVIVMITLTVIPVTFTHPFRVKRFMTINLVATTVWFVTIIWLTVVYPARPTIVWWLFWISGLWFIGTCLIRTIQGRADQDAKEFKAQAKAEANARH